MEMGEKFFGIESIKITEDSPSNYGWKLGFNHENRRKWDRGQYLEDQPPTRDWLGTIR